MIASGVIPDGAIDTLLMYAYVEPGIKDVRLEINQDEDNDGKNPFVKYVLTLKTWKRLLFKVSLLAGKGILGKIFVYLLAKFGAPVGIRERVMSRAKDYLPPNFGASVEVK